MDPQHSTAEQAPPDTLSPKALQQSIERRVDNYLVSLKHAIDYDGIEDGLMDEVLASGVNELEQRKGRFERTLLEVEAQKLVKEQKQREVREQIMVKVRASVLDSVRSQVKSRIENTEDLTRELLRMPSSYRDVMAACLHKNTSIQKISANLQVDLETSNRLIELCSNSIFCKMIGQSSQRDISSLGAAIGVISIDLITIIYPAIVCKRAIRENETFKFFHKKLWLQMLSSALGSMYLLHEIDHPRPTHAFFATILCMIGKSAVYAQILRCFDEVLFEMLEDARRNGNKALHGCLMEVELGDELLSSLLSDLAFDAGKQIAEGLRLDDVDREVAIAVDEFYSQMALSDRSEMGKAISQSIAVAQIKVLSRSKLIERDAIDAYLKQHQLSYRQANQLLQRNLFRINYKEIMRW